jgi:ribosome-associated protein
LSRASSGTDAVLTAAAASASKKAQDIIILDVSARLVITDYFLICSGNTDRQVRTIAEEVERRMQQDMGRKPVRREGIHEGGWVVLDFIDFVVHVFRKEERAYYELERLWSDVPVVEFHDEREERDEPAAAEAT